MAAGQYKYHVFLSHNTVQKDWVRKLARRLRDEGLLVFFDEDSIQLGEDIVASLERALRGSRHVLLVLSPEAVSSQWVALELSTSLYRDPGAAARSIIPILRADCDIPLTLARLRYLDARRDDDFEGQIGHLIKAIDRVAINVTGPTQSATMQQERVIARGKNVFQTGGILSPDSEVYVAREADRLLNSWLDQESLVCTVWGPRQVGKSSLVVRAVSHFRAQQRRASFVDLSGLGGDSLPQVLFGICEILADDLSAPQPDAHRFLASGFGPQQAFSRYLTALGPSVLIAFDEVDYLRAIGELAAFFRILRSVHERAAIDRSDVRFLISSVLPPTLFLEDELSSPFNIGHVLQLGNFNLEEARTLFEKGGTQISLHDLMRLFETTGGQPFLTHVAASLVREGRAPSKIVADAGASEGPFAMHLQSVLTRLNQSSTAKNALRKFRAGQLTVTRAHELIEIGILTVDDDELRYNSRAYREFFSRVDLEVVG